MYYWSATNKQINMKSKRIHMQIHITCYWDTEKGKKKKKKQSPYPLSYSSSPDNWTEALSICPRVLHLKTYLKKKKKKKKLNFLLLQAHRNPRLVLAPSSCAPRVRLRGEWVSRCGGAAWIKFAGNVRKGRWHARGGPRAEIGERTDVFLWPLFQILAGK